MKRSFTLLVLGVLMLGACAGAGRQVASVNGRAITLGEVAELRTDNAVDSEEFRQDLFRVIATEALVQAIAEDYGIEVTDQQVQEKLDALESQIEQEQSSVDEFLDSQGVTRALLERVAMEQAVREAIDDELANLVEAPTETEIEAAYEGGLPGFTTVCAKHILVSTQQEAQEVLERLEMGEDFAETAQEVSLDTASASQGGELSCTTASVFDPMFADAVMTSEIGELVGPVETQFGFHVIEVMSREQQAMENVRPQLESTIRSRNLQTEFQEFIEQALDRAEVEVEPEYGTWSTDPFPRIVAPDEAEEGEADTTTSSTP